MRKRMKKMVAFIMVLAMCVGMWNIPKTAKADAPDGMATTGALTIDSTAYSTDESEYWITFQATNLISGLTYGAGVNDVVGSGGMLHNGTAFDTYLVYVGNDTTSKFRWDVPWSQVDLKVGDELKIFGQFTVSGGTPFWITPTTVRCTAMTDGSVPTWELVSSEEEKAEVEETYLSLVDFNSLDSMQYYTAATLDEGKTINGQTFRAFLKYSKSEVESYGSPLIYYGANAEGSWRGIRITVTHIAQNENELSVTHCYNDSNNNERQTKLGSMTMTDGELAMDNFLQIKFPKADESDSGNLTVTINDTVLVNQTIPCVSYHKGYITAIGASGYTGSFTTYTELRMAEYKMERAEEITAADFGIEDGSYSSEQSGYLGTSLDGKKLVYTFARETAETGVRVAYGSSWFDLLSSDNNVNQYYRIGDIFVGQCTASYSTTELKPVTLEVYMEYLDLDADGIQDDARTFFRVNGTIPGYKKESESSYTFYGDGVWMQDIDALYAVKDRLRMWLNPSGSFSVESINTRAQATLSEGVLTIRGEGKVVPSVLDGVVANPETVKTICIEDGIEAVCAGVFVEYTGLEKVTYANTVTSVSDTAFTACATGVKVVSPEGYAFDGGLDDAVHVGAFSFTEIDLDRSEKTEAGLNLELKPSIVVSGTAEEGNLEATTYSGLQAEIAGIAMPVTLRKTSYGTLACDIAAESLPSDSEYQIIFKSGVMEDNDDDKNVCLGLKEDFTIYVNEAGLSENAYVMNHGTSTLSSRTGDSSQSSVYFSTTDSFPAEETGGPQVRLEPVDDESGIFLNGKKINCGLRKIHSVVYYILLDDNGVYSYYEGTDRIVRKAKAGDYLTVYGRFRYGDHVIEFEPFTYKSLGGTGTESWEVVTPQDNKLTFPEAVIDLDTTGVGYTITEGLAESAEVTTGEKQNTYTESTALYLPGDYIVTKNIDGVAYEKSVVLYHKGDVNTDDVLDVKDLVAMKKYQKDASDYGKAATQAVTSVGEDEKTQLASVREMLVAETVSKDGTELPTEIVGQQLGRGEITWTDSAEEETYITSVDITDNGTAVFGMADVNNNYTSSQEQMALFDDYGYDYIIDLNETRDFKILQITDSQIIEKLNGRDKIVNGEVTGNRSDDVPEYETNTNKDALLTKYMDQVIKDTAPDLILLTGDNVFGEFDDEGTVMQALINKMDSYGILWAPVFGNHDNESLIGVTAQCEMFNDSKYCLFNRRHEVGGNGNYTIGLAQNGEIKRSVFMMDSNYTSLPVQENVSHYRAYPEVDQLNNSTKAGFTYIQTDWYRDAAIRINTVAGKTIPSLLAYHVPTKDVYEAELAAGYITQDDDCSYSITDENRAQPGDSGSKAKSNAQNHTNVSLVKYMNEVGTDGAFFGHEHINSTSIFYAGVRWTYGVKTGCYDTHTDNAVGGTLVTLSADGYDTFTVTPKTYACPDTTSDGFECASGRHQ